MDGYGKRVLVVDDDHHARFLIGALLDYAGYTVVPACDGLAALNELSKRHFDVVVTDFHMPVLSGIELLILDNLSTLLPSRSESASDAWVPIQTWLLKLRRHGISVLLIHHAGTNGRQRGTSRREDALDTVIALRRPEDYSPEQGARFEIHFEKLRNRVDGVGAMPFEARLETLDADGRTSICWSCSYIKPPMLMRAAELFTEGVTVREVRDDSSH